MPILFTIGTFHLYSLSAFLIAAWCVFSFIFWRKLRAWGIEEERIFDLTFYSTIFVMIVSRLTFVVTHKDLFADNLLKVPALWVVPGLSFYGALIGTLLALIYLAKLYKLRLGTVVDAVAHALPASTVVGKFGSLLDGSEIGKSSGLPWAVSFVGHVDRRHPTQIYEVIVLILVMVALWTIQGRAEKNKWPYGIVGVWFFLLFALSMFPIEFLKESHVYWASVNANQVILIAMFAEAVGMLYVRAGGKEVIRPLFRKGLLMLRAKAERLYAKISRRNSS